MEVIVVGEPAIAAAVRIAALVAQAIETRGRAVLALSGGSTPLPMFDHLATIDLAWRSVDIVPVDERNVARDHPDSNWAQIQARLVGPTGARGHPFTVAPTAPPIAHELLARSDGARLDDLLDGSPIDVIHLGLGDDGHTASWPPGERIPDHVPVAAIGPFNGHRRTTLTPRAVNAARDRVWLVTGSSKRAPLAALVDGTSTAPAARVRDDASVVFADIAASGSPAPT